MQESWDDLLIVLALARAGRLDAAAGTLGVDPSTVFRRTKAFEARLGTAIFDRREGRYRPTAEGEAIVAHAMAMEEASLALQRQLAGGDVSLRGSLRITMPDTLSFGLMPGHLRAFRDRYPDIVLETVVSSTFLSLSRREADIAIRPVVRPEGAMVGRRLATIAFGLYAAPAYLTRHGRPDEVDDLAGHHIVSGDETMAHLGSVAWLAECGREARVVYRSQSMMDIASAARAGQGLAALPCFLADREPALERIGFLPDSAATGLWLLTHEEIRTTARVRAFLDFVGPRLAARKDLFDPR